MVWILSALRLLLLNVCWQVCKVGQHLIVECRWTLKRPVNKVRWSTSLQWYLGVRRRAFLSRRHVTVKVQQHQLRLFVPLKSTYVHCLDVIPVITFCMMRRSWPGGPLTIPTSIQCTWFILNTELYEINESDCNYISNELISIWNLMSFGHFFVP